MVGMARLLRHLKRHLSGLIVLVFTPMLGLTQQPHEHSIVALNLALEERVLFVEMIWSLHDIAGFEHWPPGNDAEQDSFDNSVAVVSDPRSVFSLPPKAKCKIKDVDTEGPLEAGADHEANGDDHVSNDVGQEAHVDLTISYRFKCKAPDELAEIRLHLFRLFPDLRAVRANLITESAQTFQELTFAEPVLFLPR